jgi:transposase-like protein
MRRKVIEMALNGSGVRETGCVLKISYNTVIAQLKKSLHAESSQPSLFASS